MTTLITAGQRLAWASVPRPSSIAVDKIAAALAMLVLGASMFAMWFGQVAGSAAPPAAGDASSQSRYAQRETVVSAYAGAPVYHRSDLKLQRPDGTDMTLKNMGWDGDSFYFPIDGGARVIRWSGAFGGMIDFLHNKAVTRLGKGAHGRKIKNGVIEDVETIGTLKGQPAPSPLHLTDLLERLEFTHGHNVLIPTALVRLVPLSPALRPYLGIGFGAAVPHVEVRFKGESPNRWTNEYQYAGPAFQVVAGIEMRIGRGSYYVEYKFIWSAIHAALTGGNSWSLKDLRSDWLPRWLIEPLAGLTEMPGDLWRQYSRWRSGTAPAEGTIETHLTSHEIVIGGGYVWPGAAPVTAGPVQP
ncbi:lipid A oxidase [Hyphomicrobium sp. 1Nfss2.1]|uniref:lipid A oxidase n=1 Tax=Hyphomicrobium sp. 1Nfss2.1 TaxID=3413936 RepID=UPI003C798617